MDENGVPIPQFTGGFDDTQIFKPGLPLGAYYVEPITSYNDANSDGLIACPDGPGTRGLRVHPRRLGEYLGVALPDRRSSTSRRRCRLGRFARVTATLDHRSGQKLYNLTGVYRNAIFLNGAAGAAADASNLKEQAAAQAAANGFNGGYIEDASFTKLREVARRAHAAAALRGAGRAPRRPRSRSPGRNLHTWTKYSGLDPELNAGAQANFSTADFLTAPQVRYFTARLALGF